MDVCRGFMQGLAGCWSSTSLPSTTPGAVPHDSSGNMFKDVHVEQIQGTICNYAQGDYMNNYAQDDVGLSSEVGLTY